MDPSDSISQAKSGSNTEDESAASERRAQARSLLISLATDARSFRDQTLRARCLARIADALWEIDADQARILFRKAWEAAETADRENQEPLNVRRQVLIMTAKRDRVLADGFLEKLKTDLESKTGNSTHNLWELPEALEQRLNLAESFLSTGDLEHALQFADPVLGNVTISTLDFLTQLRGKDSIAADKRYAFLLANTGTNMLADANTISLLSSYIFTPHMYVIFNHEGSASWYTGPSSLPPADVAVQLRLAFFQTAAAILLRAQPTADQDRSTTGIAGKYMVVKRLLPLFEQYAPKEIAVAMHGQLEALSSLVTDGVRQGEDEWVRKGISPDKQLFADTEQSLLDQIDHSKTSVERDDLYFKLALLALSKDDPKARDYVGKIDESGFRNQALAWVDWSQAVNTIKKKKVEAALEIVRTGELSHIQRVWVLTHAAKLLTQTQRDKAVSLLEDATSEARRIDGSDVDRPRALLAIANGVMLIEPSRTWDAIFDAVKAANSAETFTGEGGLITVTINSKSQILRKTELVSEFDIKGIFGEAAAVDYDRAVQLAAGFQAEAPRANATIAIARAVLNDKRVSVSSKK